MQRLLSCSIHLMNGFANTTIATIKKNLRTTNGRHKIEIDEKVLAKYMCNDLQK